MAHQLLKKQSSRHMGGRDMIDSNTNVLVVSAHAADFVWRSGGAIAKYVKNGANVHLVILSYGARGESNDLWNVEGQTLENVKETRKGELLAAAKCLGLSEDKVDIWDYQDYHMDITEERMEQLTRKIREVQPHMLFHMVHVMHLIQTMKQYQNLCLMQRCYRRLTVYV